MTSFIIDTVSTSGQSLVLGESGIITANGALVVAAPSAVDLTYGAYLTVAGTLQGTSYGASLSNGGQVNISSTGVVVSGVHAIYALGTGQVSVTNAGTVSGGFSALNLTGTIIGVANSGTMTGYDSVGISVAASSNEVISNSGTIFGFNYGIFSGGTSFEYITNSGTITGGFNALYLNESGSRVINSGTLSGTTALNGGDDYFDGSQGVQDYVVGGDGEDTIIGGVGNDQINGDNDNDILRGMGGDDELNGDAGLDTIRGGDGDDTVQGNSEADNLFGNAGDDKLFGGAGKDSLSGGEGSDEFYFDTALSATTNVDKISTLSSIDRIVLDNDIFTGLGTSFTLSEFRSIATGTSFASVDASDNIIYLKSTGDIYYDHDGSGTTHAAIKFVDLAANTTVSFSHFLLIE